MTAIAWDGRILAADRQYGYGGLCFETKKIYAGLGLRGKLRIASGCGTANHTKYLCNMILEGCHLENWPAWQKDEKTAQTIVLIEWSIKTNQYLLFSLGTIPVQVHIPGKSSWGSGADFCMGAMASGSSAIQAVELACAHIDSCGKGVDWIDTQTGESTL